MLNIFYIGWPWVGIGAAFVIILLLFCTNVFRNDRTRGRWFDPVWLTWLAVPVYLIHQFEEYALNFNLSSLSYTIIDGVTKAQGYSSVASSLIPMTHYPLVNIGLVWISLPIGALLTKKTPMIGIAFYGFILVNALLHVVMSIIGGTNPGVVTGLLLFIPISAWVVYAVLKGKTLSGLALTVSLVAGVLAHILLGVAYALARIGGPSAVLTGDIFTVFSPIVIAFLGARLLGKNAIPKKPREKG